MPSMQRRYASRVICLVAEGLLLFCSAVQDGLFVRKSSAAGTACMQSGLLSYGLLMRCTLQRSIEAAPAYGKCRTPDSKISLLICGTAKTCCACTACSPACRSTLWSMPEHVPFRLQLRSFACQLANAYTDRQLVAEQQFRAHRGHYRVMTRCCTVCLLACLLCSQSVCSVPVEPCPGGLQVKECSGKANGAIAPVSTGAGHEVSFAKGLPVCMHTNFTLPAVAGRAA